MSSSRAMIYGLVLAGLMSFTLTYPAGAEVTESAKSAEEPAKVTAEVKTDSERALLERAKEYWDARIARSNDVYRFYPPRKARAQDTVPAEFGGMGYSNYTIQHIKVDGERGFVVVDTLIDLSPELRGKLAGSFDYAKHMQKPVGEEWILVDQEWYKKPAYGGLSRFMKARRDKVKAQQAAAAEVEAEAEAEAESEAPEESE